MAARPERHGSAAAAVADIPDGASILVAGFHAGVPWNLMRALHGQGASDLVMISTTVNRPLLGVDGRVTIADLVAAGRVRREASASRQESVRLVAPARSGSFVTAASRQDSAGRTSHGQSSSRPSPRK